jgi:putative membrane protein insertion efficiency factor
MLQLISPLNRLSKSLTVIFILATVFLSAKDFETYVNRLRGPIHTDEPIESNSKSITISLYQQYISPVDGDRCQMYPSCSHYADSAMKNCGILKGYLMTTDRLMRCGQDITSYRRIFIDLHFYAYDPISDSFWYKNAQ